MTGSYTPGLPVGMKGIRIESESNPNRIRTESEPNLNRIESELNLRSRIRIIRILTNRIRMNRIRKRSNPNDPNPKSIESCRTNRIRNRRGRKKIWKVLLSLRFALRWSRMEFGQDLFISFGIRVHFRVRIFANLDCIC